MSCGNLRQLFLELRLVLSTKLPIQPTCRAHYGQRPGLRAGEAGVHLGELRLQVPTRHHVPPSDSWFEKNEDSSDIST